MRKHLYAIGFALLSLVSWASHSVFHLSTYEVMYAVTSASAAVAVGLVAFDFKAYLRAAAVQCKLVTDRLGRRTCSVGSLCTPHGL